MSWALPAACWMIRGSAGSRSPTIRAADRCFRPTGWPESSPAAAANVVVHLTCKDLNRSGLEAAAWRYASEGFPNILALTGDYPTAGFRGLPEPVFDLDSVGLIALLRAMNEGLEVPGRGGKTETLPKTDFFIGAAVSPFKRHERELMPQYYKLLRKIRCRAQWVIPQLGYDMRKFHEIKLLLASRGMADIPVIGNVYLLTRGVAKLFNSGKLAGCVVSDELLAQCEKYAAGPDKGQAFFRELAAKQLAVFRGLGFAAGYLGGSANWKPSARSSIWPRATRPTIGESSSRKFSSRNRRVLPFRARSSDGAGKPRSFQPAVHRLACPSAEIERSHAELSAFALRTSPGLHAAARGCTA